jgi:hypothetical protein
MKQEGTTLLCERMLGRDLFWMVFSEFPDDLDFYDF